MKLRSVYRQTFPSSDHGFDQVLTFYVLWKDRLYCLNEYSLNNEQHEVSGWKMDLGNQTPTDLIYKANVRGRSKAFLLDDVVQLREWLVFQNRIKQCESLFVEYSKVKDPLALDDPSYQEFVAGI